MLRVFTPWPCISGFLLAPPLLALHGLLLCRSLVDQQHPALPLLCLPKRVFQMM
jgi:hypothetical protein